MPKSIPKLPNRKNSHDVFETQNLYQGAYCLCRGLYLIGKKRDGAKVTLIFRGDKAQEVAMEFYAQAKVEAKIFSDNYRSVKDFCFER